MLSAEQIAPKRAVPMSRTTYHQLAELGTWRGRRVQLLYGTVIDMSPMGTLHGNVLQSLTRVLLRQCPDELDVRVQLPLAAADDSEPEPDFAFVPRLRSTSEDHPSTARLVIEVADTSKNLDLGAKARLYAECDVPEYWVIDLAARTTVVHRTPKRGKYSSVRRTAWSQVLSSTAVAGLAVKLADVLPR